MPLKKLLAKFVEANAQKPVAKDQLRGWFFYATVLIGFTICIPVFMLGPQLTVQTDFKSLAIGAYAGGFLLTVIACLAGYTGMKTRLPTPGVIRNTFGTKGSLLAILVLSVTSFGWFGVQAEVFANSFAQLLKTSFNINLPVTPLILVSGLLMSSTAIIGIKALGRLSYISVPLLLLVLFWPLVDLGQQDKLSGIFSFAPEKITASVGMVISIVAGGWIVGASLTPDLARFQKDTKNMILGLTANFFIAYPTLLLLTAAVAAGFGQSDFVTIMIGAGLALPTILVLFFATWTTNDKNLYESSLAISALVPQYPRWAVTAIAGVLGTGVAMLGITAHFIPLLIALGILIAPLAGVYIVDFWLQPELYKPNASQAVWRSTPFLAWILGSGFGYLTLPEDALGAGLFTLTTIPALDAILAGALCKMILTSTIRKRRRISVQL